MTIYMFSGNPGTGKTYHIVKEVILPELQSPKPRQIYHNIRLKPEVIECELLRPTALHGIVHPVTADWFLKMYDHVDELKGSLIIIDEVQNVFNSSRPMSDMKLVEFFTTHRHHCIDIVLGTQENSNINKVVRSLIEVDNRFYKLKDKTGVNAYRVETWYKDDRKATGTKKRLYDPEYFKFYSSYALGAVSAGLTESPVVPKNYTVRSYLIMAGLALAFVLYAGYTVYASFSHKADKFQTKNKPVEKVDIPSSSEKNIDVPSPVGQTQNNDFVSDDSTESKGIKVALYAGGYRTIENTFRVSALTQLGIKYIYTLHLVNSETEDGINENFRVIQFEKTWEVGDVIELETLKAPRMGSNKIKDDLRAETRLVSDAPSKPLANPPMGVEGVNHEYYESLKENAVDIVIPPDVSHRDNGFKPYPAPNLGRVSPGGYSASNTIR